jgi:hypothetical protein
MLVKNCYELRVKYSVLRLIKFQVLCTTQRSRRPTDGQTDKGIRDFEGFIPLSLTCTYLTTVFFRRVFLHQKNSLELQQNSAT